MAQTFWDINDPESVSVARAVELLWGDAIMNLRATNGEVFVPRPIVQSLLGNESLITMADRLANLMNKPVNIIVDEARDCYCLVASNTAESVTAESVPVDGSSPTSSPTSASVSMSRQSSVSTTVSPRGATGPLVPEARVPRPPNCFILYRQDHHQEIKDSHPGITNNEISRMLGARWNAESTAVRQRYTSLADHLKRQHAIDHPNYQYAPRRPSERKRRATRARSNNLTASGAEELFGSSQFTSPNGDYSVSVGGNFMGVNDQDILFDPHSAAPFSMSFNEPNLQTVTHDQFAGINFGSMDYSAAFANAMDIDIPHNGVVSISALQ